MKFLTGSGCREIVNVASKSQAAMEPSETRSTNQNHDKIKKHSKNSTNKSSNHTNRQLTKGLTMDFHAPNSNTENGENDADNDKRTITT